jgi:hypothetical protein
MPKKHHINSWSDETSFLGWENTQMLENTLCKNRDAVVTLTGDLLVLHENGAYFISQVKLPYIKKLK